MVPWCSPQRENTMPKRHSELGFAPMCAPEKNGAWFAISFIRHTQREARDAFLEATAQTWRLLKKEGWRIVRVKVVQQ